MAVLHEQGPRRVTELSIWAVLLLILLGLVAIYGLCTLLSVATSAGNSVSVGLGVSLGVVTNPNLIPPPSPPDKYVFAKWFYGTIGLLILGLVILRVTRPNSKPESEKKE